MKFGLAQLKKNGIHDVSSFSSPGWQGSAALHNVLLELGFDLVADQHGHALDCITRIAKNGGLLSVPTNMTGEPGGVGYIEHLRALGMDDDAAVEKFKKDLTAKNKFAVAYDHPYFAGRSELNLVEKMVLTARDCGYSVVTMNEIATLLNRKG